MVVVGMNLFSFIIHSVINRNSFVGYACVYEQVILEYSTFYSILGSITAFLSASAVAVYYTQSSLYT